MSLTKEQIARYSRQLVLPQVGVAGQKKLLDASVLVIGAGGLGSPAGLYLAAAGVGRLGIMDQDVVSTSNLHRQILHSVSDLGKAKSYSAKTRLASLNPDIEVQAIQERFCAQNAKKQVADYDLVLDGSDNFTTRYLVNDACVIAGVTLVHAGVVHLQGQLMTILPRQSACFRCVFPEPPQAGQIPGCQQAGVLGSAAGVIGTLMAHEALKVLLGLGELLTNRLLIFDGQMSRFREVPLRRDPHCAVCGHRPTIRELVEETGNHCEQNVATTY
ncbi:MAG: HesA/MoeB/ThiF family protein [Candidatus Omnitrophica bacterium]|nr:HesA/MoeB/ThiF family protein [Candidatus Omnitrophota bacterium]MBI2174647.1 HesA/MoeB/ThiF family protein [Candidatus Omnitrophota bacterium]